MAPVFGLTHLGRRCVESVVGLFAILGFIYVPLGRHTGFEHAKAVLSTPAASAAIDDLTRAALDLRGRAFDFISGKVTALPHAEETATEEPKAHAAARAPRPVPPKLK